MFEWISNLLMLAEFSLAILIICWQSFISSKTEQNRTNPHCFVFFFEAHSNWLMNVFRIKYTEFGTYFSLSNTNNMAVIEIVIRYTELVELFA